MEDEFLFLLVIAHDYDVRIYLQESDVIHQGRKIDVSSVFHICCDKHLIVLLSCKIKASDNSLLCPSFWKVVPQPSCRQWFEYLW